MHALPPPDRLRRTMLMLGAGACIAPAFIRHARAADTERFALGIASGCPRPDSLVLWTRLGGAGLPRQVAVQWELAADESFQRIVARGSENARADEGHSVHAEPAGLAPGCRYWYRFSALGQRSAAGRTRTAPAADGAEARLRFAIASCQRWDHGLYTAWGDMAARNWTWCSSWVTTSTNPAARRRARRAMRRAGTRAAPAARLPPIVSVMRSTSPTRCCRPCMRRRPGSRSGTTTRRRTTGPARCPRISIRISPRAAPRRPRPTGSTCRCPRPPGRPASRCRSSNATTGAVWPASSCWTTASSATRRSARRRAVAAPPRSAPRNARPCSTRAAACSAPRRSNGWPAVGTPAGPGTCSASRR